jgi:hypothetical protein
LEDIMADVPKWSLKGDWFDTCKCAIPCPCYFAQPPTYGDCDGVLAWHIREGDYGGVKLAGLNVMALGTLFAKLIAEVRGIEYVPIEFDVADDLASWRAEIPGKVLASAEALSGPTSLPGKRVQVYNPAGSEVGPGAIATQGKATADRAEAFGFKWDWPGRSSKHMRFDWSGPDSV